MSGADKFNNQWSVDHSAKALPLRSIIINWVKMWGYKQDSSRIDAYTKSLHGLNEKTLEEALEHLAETSKFMPSPAEIKKEYQLKLKRVATKETKECTWCSSTGRILAKRKDDSITFAFRCQCEIGKEYSTLIPYWDTNRHSKTYERH